jgi:hypothetical protein
MTCLNQCRLRQQQPLLLLPWTLCWLLGLLLLLLLLCLSEV